MSKRSLGLGAGILAALVLLLAFGVFPQEPLRRLAERRLVAAFGPGTRVGHLAVTPGRLDAEIDDLVLDTPAFHAEIPKAHVRLGWATLLGHSVDLAYVDIQRPRIVVRVAASGAPAAPGPAFTSPILIRSIAVDGGHLEYDDPASGGRVTLDGLALHGSIGSGTLALDVSGGRFERGAGLALGPVSVRARVSPLLDVTLDSLDACAGASCLKAQGRLGRVARLDPDLGVTGSIDLAELARLAEIPDVAGTVALQGHFTSKQANATLTSASLHIQGRTLEAFEAKLDRNAEEITSDLHARLAGGRVEARAALQGRQVDFRARLSDLVLERLVTAPAGFRGTLSGELTSHGDTDGALVSQATLSLDAATGGSSAKVLADASGTLEPRSRRVSLDWSVTADADGPVAGQVTVKGQARGDVPPQIDGVIEGALTLDGPAGRQPIGLAGTLHAQGAASGLELHARGLRGEIATRLEMQSAEIRELVVHADGLDLAQLVSEARGRLRFDVTGSGRLDRPAGSLQASADALAWRGAELGSMRLGAEAAAGRGSWSFEAPDLHVKGTGALEGTSTVSGDVDLMDLPLATVAPLLPPPQALDGRVTGRVSFRVPLARPAGAVIDARMEAVSAASGRYALQTIRPFSVALRDGRVELQDVSLEGSGLSLQLAGTTGLLATSPVDLKCSASVDLGRAPAPEGWTLSGGGGAEIAVGGTRAQPRVTGRLTAHEVAAAGPSLPPLRVAEAALELTGDALQIPETTATLAGGSLTVSGMVPLGHWLATPGTTKRARLDLAWKEIESADLLAALRPGQASPVRGLLAGQLQVVGAPESPAELEATLQLPQTQLSVDELALQIEPVDVHLSKGRLDLGRVSLGTEGGTLTIGGTADLRRRTLDTSAKGSLELRALSPFLSEVSLTGKALVDVAVGGSFDTPRPQGTVVVRDGAARVRDVPQALTEIAARLRFDAGRLTIEEGSAVLGGGRLEVKGDAGIGAAGLGTVNVTATGRDLALRYPEGLRTRLDADLALTGKGHDLRLGGTVTVQRGLYDLDTALDQSLAAVPEPVQSPLLRSVALEVAVTIENPVIVNNNLAHLEVTGDLAVKGDLETPAPFGRVEIGQGGSLYLQGRDFRIQSGRLTYQGDWNPVVSLTANRKIDEYLVTLAAEGPMLSVQPVLSAQRVSAAGDTVGESLSQGEIISLIATGQRTQGPGVGRFMGEQAAALLAGRLSSGVLKGLGLAPPNQPELLGRELDPGPRLTFGKQLARQLSLVYSLGLNGPEQRFIQLALTPGYAIDVKSQRTDDGTLTFALGQRLRRGGERPTRATSDEAPRLSEVRLSGDRPLDEAVMRGALKAKPGRRVSVWALQEDADRLRDRLIREWRLAAEVTARLEGDVAVFQVRAGPRYRWRVEGMTHPPDLGAPIRQALYEEEALDRGQQRLLAELRARGHLRASVAASALADGENRTLVFGVHPGPQLAVAHVRFPGASAVSEKTLLAAAGGPAALLASPEEARRKLEALYRSRHRLAAHVDIPRIEERSEGISISVPIQEGPAARIAAVRFEGATLPESRLAEWAAVPAGADFEPPAVTSAVDRLRDGYLGLGYPAVRVAASAMPHAPDVDVVFAVAEGERVVIGSVEIVGLVHTRESLVRRQIRLPRGEPLDIRKLTEIERRLLALGMFSRISVTASAESPATITVRVQEDANLVAAYDVRYTNSTATDTEDSSTFSHAQATVDVERRNIFGFGLALGGNYRVGSDAREARGSLRMPVGRGSTSVTAFHLEADADAVDFFTGEPFTNTTLQRGLRLQQSTALGLHASLLYSYRFKRVTSTILPDPIDIAGVDTSLVHDTRDNALDPHTGRLLSVTLELSPKWLGADFTFVKGYAQAFFAHPLTKALGWAQSARLGLAHTFGGQILVSSERFTAGGANSLRGFENGAVGPRDVLGDPTGGQAVVIVNEELRYRHTSGIGTAVFYDVGNIFESVSDLSFDLRHTLGVGLRYESPVGLLRLDVGFPLGRQEREKAYQLFFSLGQAF